MLTGRVRDFAPVVNGFPFANAFPSVPARTLTIPRIGTVTIGNAANGLCGGMAFAARDFFECGLRPPADAIAPAAGSPLFDYLVDRLVASFDFPLGPAHYYQWMSLPDPDAGLLLGVASRTRAAWPQIRSELDSGKPAPLGLIRAHSTALTDLGKNHQVLAYGYDVDETTNVLTLSLYDPNHPGVTTTLSCNLGAGTPLDLVYSSGELTRGFFLTNYRRSDPRFLFAEKGSRSALPWIGFFSQLGRMFR